MTWLRDRLYIRAIALTCSMAILPGDVLLYGQTPPPQTAPNQQQLMTPEQLDSLIAPIALYPDPLLGQVLAASTYPLEIVTAERWVGQNSNLQGKALVEAAARQDWDPSIQALVAFPTVLQMMNQSLDWTTALGNAFLAQQPDVMAAVQRMRMRAEQSGKLQSTPQQQVQNTTVDGQPTIVIQPANPEVIYVPTYDPTYVWGAAPAYYPYPSFGYPFAAGAIAFGVGVAVGAIFNGGWGWGWGVGWGPRPSVYVNNNFFTHNGNTFVNRGRWGNTYAGNGRVAWNHNPRYRGAVPYPNRDVANRYNGGQGGLRPAQRPANMGNIRPPGSQFGPAGRAGLPGNVGTSRPAAGLGPSQLPTKPGGGNPLAGRGGPSQLPTNIPNRPSTGSASRVTPGGQWGGWGGSQVSPGSRGGAFAGGNAGQARQFSNRGASSMGGFRGGGGGFRGGGGGGFRGGGGGRRGGRR
jgi:uncharacterized membrane protein YgcG